MLTITGTNDKIGIPEGAQVIQRLVAEYNGRRAYATQYKATRHFSGGWAVETGDGMFAETVRTEKQARKLAAQLVAGLTAEQLAISESCEFCLSYLYQKSIGREHVAKLMHRRIKNWARASSKLESLGLIVHEHTPNDKFTAGYSIDTKITDAGKALYEYLVATAPPVSQEGDQA